MVVFDNWRVLHGRSSFKGKRRICGGYSKPSESISWDCLTRLLTYKVNHDDYVSRWRNTNYTRDEALAQIL